jgi:hypothetical protein
MMEKNLIYRDLQRSEVLPGKQSLLVIINFLPPGLTNEQHFQSIVLFETVCSPVVYITEICIS